MQSHSRGFKKEKKKKRLTWPETRSSEAAFSSILPHSEAAFSNTAHLSSKPGMGNSLAKAMTSAFSASSCDWASAFSRTYALNSFRVSAKHQHKLFSAVEGNDVTCQSAKHCTKENTIISTEGNLKRLSYLLKGTWTVCLLVGCLTSQQQASVSQGRICSDNFTCCHTKIEVADPTFYLTQS